MASATTRKSAPSRSATGASWAISRPALAPSAHPVLVADILVLMAQGFDNDMIDRRLTLLIGTTGSLAEGILREPGISRDLLRETAAVFRADQPNRLSWTIVPVSMRDRRGECIAATEE